LIKGNTEGIRKVYIEKLEQLYEIECGKNNIITFEMLDIICSITSLINKEISVYINRRGRVIDVSVGDRGTVSIEPMTEKRSIDGLSGIRCIHTHPGGSSVLSPADLTALITLKFDLIAAIGVANGRPLEFSFGYLKTENGKIKDQVLSEGPYDIKELYNVNVLNMVSDIEGSIYDKTHETDEKGHEMAILVGCESTDMYSTDESLDELSELASTAGAEVVYKIIQNRNKIDPAFYIGSGKAREIALLRQSLMASLVIFDDELSGVQVRNLEEVIGCKVIDRTTLILDIFAQRAKTREGKIQVELAQMKYRLPRLIGTGDALSRTGGGIGTRGPGEKKLEIDKRYIRKRILDLSDDLEDIRKTRELHRVSRKANEIPVVTLSGYTNAGKSTLRNKLCELYGTDKEKVYASDILFATLDTTTRVVKLQSGFDILLSDTVGFIRKLPHELVEAFKSTLEEVAYSDLIVHVVDASNKNALAQIETVNSVLEEIGAKANKVIIAFNKIDKADSEEIAILRGKYPEAIEISALNNINLDILLEKIEREINRNFIHTNVLIPYSDGKMLSYLHDSGCVENEEYKDEGILVKITAAYDVYGKVKKYEVKSNL
jgi:GTP-binding protein HflX